uniref:NADH-ubiquinone oxidoreductase chain 4L n=1 Tax=Urodontus glabratus TaxID=1205599 RepID=A0A0S2MSK2_9CUCU|nr:NADH deshydrogenase subunit 4L [Urodontus glabratus]
MLIYVSSIFMSLSGFVLYSLNVNIFLLMLLSLEFISLSLYLGLFCYLSMYSMEYFFLMMYLTMIVCEGALGLSILVLMVRVHGNDYVLSFSMLW